MYSFCSYIILKFFLSVYLQCSIYSASDTPYASLDDCINYFELHKPCKGNILLLDWSADGLIFGFNPTILDWYFFGVFSRSGTYLALMARSSSSSLSSSLGSYDAVLEGAYDGALLALLALDIPLLCDATEILSSFISKIIFKILYEIYIIIKI